MDRNLQRCVRKIGHELVRRVNEREPLERIEEDIVRKLACVDTIGLIISGFNRRNRSSRNIIRHVSESGQYVLVLNLIDGSVNYFRNSRVYGISISVTNLQAFEQYSVVFDGLNSEIFDIGSDKMKDFTKAEVYSSQRLVVGLGRIFRLSEESFKEMASVSMRSIGSTTVSILEILRNHMDVYINKTKIWNLWWALGLCHNEHLFLEDIVDCESIYVRYKEYLSVPEKTVYLACYSDPAVKERIPNLLRDIREQN